jgi:hypothetical protein
MNSGIIGCIGGEQGVISLREIALIPPPAGVPCTPLRSFRWDRGEEQSDELLGEAAQVGGGAACVPRRGPLQEHHNRGNPHD